MGWQESLLPRYRPWAWCGAVFGIVATALVLTLAGMDALGAYNECLRKVDENCYCENVDKEAIARAVEGHKAITDVYIERVVLQTRSVVRQPVSAWSNLSAVIFGVGILWSLGRGMRSSSDAALPNPMAGPTPLSVGYGMILVFMGPGSMCLHVTLTRTGGWLDNLSMNFFISFVLLYDVFRTFRISGDGWFYGVWSAVNVLLAVLVFPGLIHVSGMGRLVFGVLVVAVLAFELVLSCPHWPVLSVFARLVAHVRRPRGFFDVDASGVHLTWLFTGLGCFGIAFLIWNLSGDGAPLCDPASWLQGHGTWHVLSYASIVCFFLNFRSENTAPEDRHAAL